MPDKSLSAIRDFLAQRRIALVGASRSASGFSANLFRDLRRAGYDVVPVNPIAQEIDGVRCFARVADIAPPPDAALILVPSEKAAPILRECAEAGIGRVWLYGYRGPSKIAPAAREEARRLGLTAVAGYCPYMFMQRTQWFHHLHGAILKIARAYPS